MPDAEKSCKFIKFQMQDNIFAELPWTHMSDTNRVKAPMYLMAPHSIGRTHKENSGYEGQWQDDENLMKFNENYFVSIGSKGWRPVRKVGGRWDRNFWMRADAKARPGRGLIWDPKDAKKGFNEMMLNTDLCLFYTSNTKIQ
jgi:catalase (peroxidase I)